MTLHDFVVLIVGLPAVIGLFGCTVYGIYLGHTKGKVIAENLKNCSPLLVDPRFVSRGMRGHLLRIASITGIFIHTRYLIKKSVVSQSDIDGFPPELRRKMLCLFWTAMANLAALSILALLITTEALK